MTWTMTCENICVNFTGLNKTILSNMTKFHKMHELFKQKRISISLLCTDLETRNICHNGTFFIYSQEHHITKLTQHFFKHVKNMGLNGLLPGLITQTRNWFQQMSESYTTSEETRICIFFQILKYFPFWKVPD